MGGWGLGVLPQKISGLNGVNSCSSSSRQDNHRNEPPPPPPKKKKKKKNHWKLNFCEDIEKGNEEKG